MDDEYEEDQVYTPPMRFHPSLLLMIGFQLCQETAQAFVNSFATAKDLSAAHFNWHQHRESMREQASLEIEMMTRGDADG